MPVYSKDNLSLCIYFKRVRSSEKVGERARSTEQNDNEDMQSSNAGDVNPLNRFSAESAGQRDLQIYTAPCHSNIIIDQSSAMHALSEMVAPYVP